VKEKGGGFVSRFEGRWGLDGKRVMVGHERQRGGTSHLLIDHSSKKTSRWNKLNPCGMKEVNLWGCQWA